MVIKFREIGSNLSTRNQGTKIGNFILEELSNGSYLEFDFEDVYVISNSFADECFGKLLLHLNFEVIRNNTTFKNIETFNKKTISFAINQRIKERSKLG